MFSDRTDDVRVSNAGEYSDGFYIECLHDWNSGRFWAVPAWDEWGYADLEGPFETKQAAERVLATYYL
jgi:hypothetical protein